MKSFLSDGYIYICKREDSSFVISRDKSGTDSYGLACDSEGFTDYSYQEAENYWESYPSMRFVIETPKPTQTELLEYELSELETWFNWYDEQCMQYQRSLRLGTKFDKDIAELDSQAVVNSARIKELRKALA